MLQFLDGCALGETSNNRKQPPNQLTTDRGVVCHRSMPREQSSDRLGSVDHEDYTTNPGISPCSSMLGLNTIAPLHTHQPGRPLARLLTSWPQLLRGTSTAKKSANSLLTWHPCQFKRNTALAEAGAKPPFATAMSGSQRFLHKINEATKFAVSGAVALVLLWRHDEHAVWCVLGSLVSSQVNKVMKHVINEQRPENARKSDPGMPSSHANNLAFLGVYGAAAALLRWGIGTQALATASSLMATSLFLTWLRVALGYHSWAQVGVGYLIGAVSGAAWLHWGRSSALPAISSSPALTLAMWVLTGLGSIYFVTKHLKELRRLLPFKLSPA